MNDIKQLEKRGTKLMHMIIKDLNSFLNEIRLAGSGLWRRSEDMREMCVALALIEKQIRADFAKEIAEEIMNWEQGGRT